ncbi:exodeoxyribonuclease VII small subunit [uncultured Mailhella sp.]|uniref:exodeoxyribonuclease VII small subunit n=1 Tax=uncultured Mailhella sp. TaxID=1981031 RepID=UPI0032094E60
MKKKEPTFEERLARLQAIVTTLEAGNSPLEESVALYKEGLAHAAACREQLEKARHDIRLCTEAGAEPFDAGSQEDDE